MSTDIVRVCREIVSTPFFVSGVVALTLYPAERVRVVIVTFPAAKSHLRGSVRTMADACSFKGCEHPVNAQGLCAAHYEQLRKGQRLRPVKRRSGPPKSCAFPSCDRLAGRGGYCATHYRQSKTPRGLRPIHRRDPGALCAFDGCDHPAICKGLCRAHYAQQRNGKTLKPLRKVTPRTVDVCVVPGCSRTDIKAHGLCRSHYSQYQRGEEVRALRARHGSYEGINCAFPGCGRQAVSCGMCEAHYYQARAGLDLRPIRAKTYDGMVCSVEGCTRRPTSNGMCNTHWVLARRAVIDAMKRERGCADCGCTDPIVLEFHHIDPAEKDTIVGALSGRSMARALAEVEKCEVLCANCHRIRHAGPHEHAR